MGEDVVTAEDYPPRSKRHRKKNLYQALAKLMEFYFSDANLSKDRFFSQMIQTDPNVPIETLLKCNRVRALTDRAEDIAKALRTSELLKVTEDGTCVVRTRPVSYKLNVDECEIYVERLPQDVDHQWLTAVFSTFGKVDYVSMPKYKHNGKFKGFAFIEFSTPESAQKAVEAYSATGCYLPIGMEPENLCSITTYKTEQQLLSSSHDSLQQIENVETKCRGEKRKSHGENLLEESSAVDISSKQENKIKREIKIEAGIKEEKNLTQNQDECSEQGAKSEAAEMTIKRKKSQSVSEEMEEEGVLTKKRKRKSKSTEIDVCVTGGVDTSQEQEAVNIVIKAKDMKNRLIGNDETEEMLQSLDIIGDTATPVVLSDEGASKNKRKRSSGNEDKDNTLHAVVAKEDNAEEATNTEEEEKEIDDVDEADVRRKSRKRKKKLKKEIINPSQTGLLILSKKDWKMMRNKYLMMQRSKMSTLKKHLYQQRWAGAWETHHSGRTAQMESKNSGEFEEPQKTQHGGKVCGNEELKQKKEMCFVPGVILKVNMDEPIVDVQAFKSKTKQISGVKYVDVKESSFEAFLRLESSEAARRLSDPELKLWPTVEILDGVDEQMYWDKMKRDREEKCSKKMRNQRGRDKLLKKAEKTLGKHIVFDEL